MAKVDKYKTFMLWLVVNILSVKCFSYANGSGNVITVEGVGSEPVSYTHLDVYKRQAVDELSYLLSHFMCGRDENCAQPVDAHHCSCLLYTSRCV